MFALNRSVGIARMLSAMAEKLVGGTPPPQLVEYPRIALRGPRVRVVALGNLETHNLACLASADEAVRGGRRLA